MPARPVTLLAACALIASALVAPVAAAVTPGAGLVSARDSTRDAKTEVTFIVGLPRDSDALQEAAAKRSTPGDLLYRDHLTLVEAGKAYGAKSKVITKLRKVAEPLGITVAVGKGRLLARLTASVSTWNSVYGMRMSVVEPSPGSPYRVFRMLNGDEYAATPEPLRKLTAEWVPLSAVYVPVDDIVGIDPDEVAGFESVLASPGSPLPWPRNTGTITADCSAPALQTRAVYTPDQIRTAYGTKTLASRGVRGKGARLTVISMGGGFDAKDLAEAAECFGFPVPEIDVVTGTGVVAPFVNASPETHLDLITAASVLTAADRITLLQVVDPLTGLTDAFERMLEGAEVPDVASLSYGACEAEFAESVGDYLTLNEDLLRMAAIVGTTVVAAAGDYGSSMCGAEYAAESGEPSVWYPSSSAWVTSVGGTRLVLKPDNSRRSERVWNDLPYTGDWPAPAPAGSGGASSLIERPWWQAGSTPAGPRSVPDVALLGAVRPGWPIVYGGDLFTVGGTSGGTPFLAANLAAMSAKQRERGYPTIGFSNAWLYAAAASTKSPYFDIQDGTNGVQLVGCCSAYPGYDMASGLGVPDMDLLYATLKRPAG